MLPKAKQERRSNDRYLTRPDFADWVLNVLPTNFNPKYVLDPGFGDTGALSLAVLRRFPAAKITGVDIRPLSKPRGVDTLFCMDFIHTFMLDRILNYGRRYDLVVCNPPFTLFKEFVQAVHFTLNTNGIAVFIVKLSTLEGDERFNDVWNSFFGRELEHISVCAKRPKFSSFKSADGTAYALLVFRQGYDGGPTTSFNHFDDKKAAGWCDYFRASGFGAIRRAHQAAHNL